VVITAPVLPPEEACDPQPSGYFDAPAELLDCRVPPCCLLCDKDCTDPNCVRLIQPLRAAAQTRDAREILVRAAFEYYVLLHPELPAAPSPASAQALADLAVTGEAALNSFRHQALREDDLLAPLQERLRSTFPAHGRVLRDVQGAARLALHRAHRVAWALRGPAAHRRQRRPELGWIAVDGEDDPPHRPVNVPAATFPQYDMVVPVKGIPVRTRYMVASRQASDDRPADFDVMPPDARAPLILGDIVVFIHGHSSSLEEAMPLVEPMLARGAAQGRPVTLIAMDLPSNGYASMLEHTTIAPANASSWNGGYPILDFIEEFIVAFVDQLEAQQPGLKRQIVGVIGGSLGGNMTLRLGQRDPVAHPWLHSVVSWSPASTWPSWARAVIGPAATGRYYDFIRHAGPGRSFTKMMEQEQVRRGSTKDSLYAFFNEKILHIGPNVSIDVGRAGQADQWFSPRWTCREAGKRGSHRSVNEIYNARFRRWHWRVAHEQVIFSHWDSNNRDRAVDPDPRINPSAGPPRYAQIKSRLLLATGLDDDVAPGRIHSETSAMAEAMTMVEGTTLFLRETGHTLHGERPAYFANQILDFLFAVPPPPFPYFLIPAAGF
jgi:pimeloyl-ACP methyl ester carboxylesterase